MQKSSTTQSMGKSPAKKFQNGSSSTSVTSPNNGSDSGSSASFIDVTPQRPFSGLRRDDSFFNESSSLADMENFKFPPENEDGNVEYKYRLTNISTNRLEHLTTQLKWRLEEGSGTAMYRIGVHDDGRAVGLSLEEMNESLSTLRQMMKKLDQSTVSLTGLGSAVEIDRILMQRVAPGGIMIASVLIKGSVLGGFETSSNGATSSVGAKPGLVTVATCGPSDAGKSTLLGCLIDGQPDNGRGQARLNLFRHPHEISAGRTSSISSELIGFAETPTKVESTSSELINYSVEPDVEEIIASSRHLISLFDLPGLPKYLRTTISGLLSSCPNVAMLTLPVTAPVCRYSLELAALLDSLHLPFFVVVTKTDLVKSGNDAKWKHPETWRDLVRNRKIRIVDNAEDAIRVCSAFVSNPDEHLPVIPVSCLTEHGIQILIAFLAKLHFPSSPSSPIPRSMLPVCNTSGGASSVIFFIDQVWWLGPETGHVVSGSLLSGTISVGQSVLVGPAPTSPKYAGASVVSLHWNRQSTQCLLAGQSGTIGLGGQLGTAGPEVLRKGHVILCADDYPCDSPAPAVRAFQADLKPLTSVDLAALYTAFTPVPIVASSHTHHPRLRSSATFDCAKHIAASSSPGNHRKRSRRPSTTVSNLAPNFQEVDARFFCMSVCQTVTVSLATPSTPATPTPNLSKLCLGNANFAVHVRFSRRPEFITHGSRFILVSPTFKAIGTVTHVPPASFSGNGGVVTPQPKGDRTKDGTPSK